MQYINLADASSSNTNFYLVGLELHQDCDLPCVVKEDSPVSASKDSSFLSHMSELAERAVLILNSYSAG